MCVCVCLCTLLFSRDVRVQFQSWLLEKPDMENDCAFSIFFLFSFLFSFFPRVCVCVFTECAHIKLSMSDWRQGPGWAVKQWGAPTSCAAIIKSTSVFAKGVSGNDAVIEMHDLLWLRQMDARMRERQTIHTPLLVWANSLNYAGLRGIKWRAPILPKLLRVWIIYG